MKRSILSEANLSLFTAGLFILILIACSTPASDSRTELSDSAKKANEHLDSLRRNTYRNNDLSIVFLEASARLLQTQLRLQAIDFDGKKIGVADSLIVYSTQGDTLHQALMKVYEVGRLFAKNEIDKERFAGMQKPDSARLWLEKHFKGTRTSAALTTLNQFQNDCGVINKIVRH